jgi:hypothetical protein
MSNLLGRFLTEDAKQTVLKYKLIAVRKAITGVEFTTGSVDITSAVMAVSAVATPVVDLSALGIYVGPVSGASDPKKVLVRISGSDNGVSDGNGDEVYGVLSEASGVFTLALKKANGSAFSPSSSLDLDVMIVENMDLNSIPVDAILLNGTVGGVIDATNASAVNAIEARVDALESADVAIDGRLDVLEAGAISLDSRVDALEISDASQNGRLSTLESTVASQGTRLTAAEAGITSLQAAEPSAVVVTLTASHISAKAIDLASEIGVGVKKVLMVGAVGGLIQCPGVDYVVVNGSNGLPSKISWTGLGMAAMSFIATTDKVQFIILGE